MRFFHYSNKNLHIPFDSLDFRKDNFLHSILILNPLFPSLVSFSLLSSLPFDFESRFSSFLFELDFPPISFVSVLPFSLLGGFVVINGVVVAVADVCLPVDDVSG